MHHVMLELKTASRQQVGRPATRDEKEPHTDPDNHPGNW